VRDMYSQPLDQRRYLSRPELAQTYGAEAEDLDAVERYAQQHNLVVSERNAAQRRNTSGGVFLSGITMT